MRSSNVISTPFVVPCTHGHSHHLKHFGNGLAGVLEIRLGGLPDRNDGHKNLFLGNAKYRFNLRRVADAHDEGVPSMVLCRKDEIGGRETAVVRAPHLAKLIGWGITQIAALEVFFQYSPYRNGARKAPAMAPQLTPMAWAMKATGEET